MTPILGVIPELLSVAVSAIAVFASVLTTVRKIHARQRLSKEISKNSSLVEDLIKQGKLLEGLEKHLAERASSSATNNAASEKLRHEITKLTEELFSIVHKFPKEEREIAASALEQPSQLGRLRYIEHVADEALRLEQKKHTDTTRD